MSNRKRKKYLFYRLCRFVLFLLLKAFFFFKSSGRQYLPKNGGCIIASNHLSFLDPIVLSVASTRILSFMSKEELFRNKLFAKLITALNAFPLHREGTDIKAMRSAIDKLKNGDTLIIFPEGTRSTSGEVQQGKIGISMLAAWANVPVVPAFIEGTDMALPAKSKKINFFCSIKVSFGEPLLFMKSGSALSSKEQYQIFSDKVILAIKELKNKKACKG
ncbi:MAG: 1-acyl-sn-glycerol-3-phosphate acyltransferase [Candidatus Omnitrophica bacterium]|nr:1-acyl-sn-glycerol-3-phosphate acyltransferase [Candidatus Omnitrophota bacterium]